MEQILQYMAQQSEVIATLQQQILTLQTGAPTATATGLATTPLVEAAPPPKFSGERGQVVGFINACRLFIQMRMGQVGSRSRVSWVLSYVQGGVAEVWKDNVLDEITKGTSAVNTEEDLFTKIQQEFGEFDEESRKVDELRVLEQGGRTVDEYVQEFKRAARGSGYEGRALVEEFKRGLNGTIRRRLAEAETPPTNITQWQERAVQLDRNVRQSRAEEKVLGGRKVAHSTTGEAQRPGGLRTSWNTGGFRRGWTPKRGWQQQRGFTPRLTGGERGPGAMAVDRGNGGGDRRCFNCGGFGHMARNCTTGRPVDKNGRVVWGQEEGKTEELKESGGQ